uniref:Conserved secreted protein n=1 Tax=Bursaphelenchus xylophilus TaxID=6326 RepID=A0A1I7SHW5_BURXY
MLFLMLLTPASARVSVQFVQIENRITKYQIPSLPEAVNAVSLTTVSGKQTFHHVCRDIDAPLDENRSCSATAPWNNFQFLDCTNPEKWVQELKAKLLMPPVSEPTTHDLTIFAQRPWQSFYPSTPGELDETNFLDASTAARPRTPTLQESFQTVFQPESATKSGSGFTPAHKRTVSDIPQFDQDAESIGSLSLDESIDQEVFEVVQQLIDQICDDELNQSDLQRRLDEDSATESDAESEPELLPKPNGIQELEELKEDDVPGPLPTGLKSPGERKPLYIKNGTRSEKAPSENGSIAPSTASAPVLNAISRVPDSIKRVKYGHRRQDSLQETIFSTSTQELRWVK